jgi:formamidopyrimidine-DNA glycosylase
MPELPEVETVCKGLSKSLLGRKFTNINLLRPNLRIPFPENFSTKIINRTIKDITRRAKYIFIHLDNSQVIIMHLGMSGKIIVHPSKQQILKHDHAIFTFDDNQELVFNDARRFGLITIADINNLDQHPLFKSLGPEPLTENFNTKYLADKLKTKSIPIKPAIMNNNIVVGVGNIYACESLFISNISPLKAANNLNNVEIKILITNIKQVLLDAIKSGGSSISDYVNAQGELGYFQHNFNVYNKYNHSCKICTSKIARITQCGRSTFYCPTCQK